MGKTKLRYNTKGVISQITCFIHLHFSREEELMVKLCYDYDSITSACLDSCLSITFALVTNKQLNMIENLHFSLFWFMTRCCLFPGPQVILEPRLVFPG